MHRTRNIIRIWTQWRFWLATVILVGLAWRIIDYFLVYPFIGDEASLGLNILQKSYVQLTGPLWIDVCPIGFLWLSKFVMSVFGTNPLGLRLVPLLAGIASVFLLWPAAKRLAGRRAALLAVALVACSLQTVRYSTDFKPYSIDLLAAVCLVGLGLWAIRKPADWRPLFGLVLIGIPVTIISYPSIFVATSVGACLVPQMLQKAQWRQRFLWAIFCVFTAATFWFIFFTVTRAQMGATHAEMEHDWQRGFPPHNLGIVWWIIQAHFSNMMSYPIGGGKGIAFLITPLSAFGAVRLAIKRRFAVLILLVVPFILTFAAAFFHAYPYGYQGRVAQHLVPSIALLTAIGMVTLIAMVVRKQRSIFLWNQATNGLCALLVIFSLLCIVKDIMQPPVEFADSVKDRHLTTVVFQNAGPNTQIVVEENPYHYFADLTWYLITQSHPFRIDGRIDAENLRQKHGDLWVMDFGPIPDSELGRNILQTMSERGLELRITESMAIILYPPDEPPIYGQALHFEQQAPTIKLNPSGQ